VLEPSQATASGGESRDAAARANEPANLAAVVRFVALALEWDEEDLARLAWDNARAVFAHGAQGLERAHHPAAPAGGNAARSG
jgi:hypothetical protein